MAKRLEQDKPGPPEAAADAVRRVAAEIRSNGSVEAFFRAELHPRGGKPGHSTSENEGGASSGSGAGGLPGDAAPAGVRGGNDDRSNTLNPNNPAHHAAASNRSNQMNPNNSAYRSSCGGRR